MELRVLRYFLMVAREENITKAANLLHIAQPSLSRQIMQLEEELGVKLFRRSRHRIIFTDDGMLLKRKAQEIVDLADKTKEDFLHKGEELSGEIAIGSGEFQSTQFLSELMAAFHRIHPLVRFEIYSGNSDNIKERIENGILDIGLLMEPVDISKYEFLRTPIKEEWGVLVKEDSALAMKKTITPADLIGYPLINTQRKSIQNELLNWLGSVQDQINGIASGNLLYNLAILVKNDLGVVFTVKLDCHYEGTCFIPLEPSLSLGTVLAWKKIQAMSATTSAFIEFTKKYVSGIA